MTVYKLYACTQMKIRVGESLHIFNLSPTYRGIGGIALRKILWSKFIVLRWYLLPCHMHYFRSLPLSSRNHATIIPTARPTIHAPSTNAFTTCAAIPKKNPAASPTTIATTFSATHRFVTNSHTNAKPYKPTTEPNALTRIRAPLMTSAMEVSVGKTLSCHSDNTCITGECRAKEGCMFRNNPDGIGCNDNNPCTLNDECYNGMCAVSIPKDCSYLDTFCTVGACDILTGDCIELPRNEGADCDDGLQCTLDDKCVTGKCKGHQNECFDNNPCTINVCTEESGCTVQYETETGQCIPGCTQDSECPLGFNCFDGTCVKTQRIQEQHIRMIGYEVEDCTSTASSRLIQHFVLDTKEIDFNGEKRFRIIKDPSDIVFNPRYAPLGFGDEVINLAYNHFGNGMARTSFPLPLNARHTRRRIVILYSATGNTASWRTPMIVPTSMDSRMDA